MKPNETTKQLTYSNTREQAPVNNLNYPDLAKLTQANAKRKSRIKQQEREKNSSNTVLLPSYNRNLRIVDSQSICNIRKKVGYA